MKCWVFLTSVLRFSCSCWSLIELNPAGISGCWACLKGPGVAGASWGMRMKGTLVGAGWVQDQVTHEKPCFCLRNEVQQPNSRTVVDNGAIIAPCLYLSAATGRQRIHTHLLSSPYCVRLALACYTSGMLLIQRSGHSSQERA